MKGSGQAFPIQTAGILSKVRVFCNRKTNVLEDLVMVGPGWFREVDGLVLRSGVEFCEEQGAEMDGTGAGDGLIGDNLYDTILVSDNRPDL